LIVVCETKALIFHSPPPKIARCIRKRFLCRVLVPLCQILDFPAFPLNIDDVMNKKSDIAAER
jgi:hypothetical protein